jgi:hypothetical protein
MTGAVAVLAAWLGPATWLALPALLVAQGAAGLWPALLVLVAPLLALALSRPAARPRDDAPPPTPLVHVAGYFLLVAILIWAGLGVAGDVGARLGAPRWHGIALAAAGGLLLTAWRGAERALPALLVVASLGILGPLVLVSAATGLAPVAAWRAVADRPALTFPASSRWVTEGRDLRLAQGPRPLVFEEAHRLTAAADTTVRVRVSESRHTVDREIALSAGQSITLRPGDRLEAAPGVRLRFEAGRRVPGAPASGIAWASEMGRGPGGLAELGLAVTVLGGGIALFGPPLAERPSRRGIALVGAGLVATVWAAQAWALYTVLAAPEVFMGGVAPERLIDVPGLVVGQRMTAVRLQVALVIAVGAAFLASTVALRARLSAVDATGEGEIGYDLGLWSMVFVVAAVASLWPVDPWVLARVGLGVGAAVLVPAALWPDAAARGTAATAAGTAGLGVFALLAVIGRLAGPLDGMLGVLCEHPAGPAVLAGFVVLRLAGRPGRR